MKIKFFTILFVFFLAGCAVESKETAHHPEDALSLIEDGEREIHVYGSHEVDEHLVLFIFRGFMNDEDIWLAKARKEDNGWIVKDAIHRMKGPFQGSSDMHAVVIDEDYGYEVGYIKSGASVPEDVKLIDVDGNVDLKIWIKQNAEVNF